MSEGFSVGDRIVRKVPLPGDVPEMVVISYDKDQRMVLWEAADPPERRPITGYGPVELYEHAPKLARRITL